MRKGFTLIELLAVVLIIAVLTSISLPQYRKSLENARVAEARQMLPAIYDSVDRLATESLCNSWSECGDKLVFSKLDIEMKGKSVSGQPAQWKTKNFHYYISLADVAVTAEFLTGRWNGTKITYNGDYFSCTPRENASYKQAQACDFLDFSRKDYGERRQNS